MDYKIVSEANEGLLKQAARLHLQALSAGGFITLFGEEFLIQVYKAILDDRLGFWGCASEAGSLRGFVIGLPDSTGLLASVRKRWPRIFFPIIRQVIRRPILIIKLFETLTYGERSGRTLKAELLVIAVAKSCQRQGVGRQLVALLEEEFKKHQVSSYKVTVHKDKDGANAFYRRQGFIFWKTFSLYGVEWNVYRKNLQGEG